jgi:hypothetical protein
MRFASMALASLAFITGLLAAGYWYKSSTIKIAPKTDGRFGGGIATAPAPWVAAALDALVESSSLNKTASRWTAISVVLAALSNILGC